MDIVELVDAFCTELALDDLARLALCSRKLNHISTRHLYGNIPALPPSSILALLHLLRRKPDHATLVRSFVLDIDPSHTNAFYRLVRHVLVSMSNLQSLTVHSVNEQPPKSWPDLITQELRFPFQLHHFDTDFELNDQLALFLRTQPHIVELRIALNKWPEGENQFMEDFWPPARRKLFVLTDQEYNLSTLQTLLDIPHWEQLSFGICGNDPRPHVLFLPTPSESLRHIQVEKLNGWDIESLRDFLDHLSHRTPNLEWLILMNLSGGKESFGRESLELVGRYLHPFKRLFHFSCFNTVANEADLGSEEIRSILKQWSDACPTLRSVCVRMLPLWNKGGDNQPWLSSKPS
ncbi:hypothetical protein BT96DRAFT_922548 [Gymnopus androsaceus JB14]|uniref:F-box domain-containing protein n=1 Tax=Gymnopus androsaceus JB14 TaxID=1447944 RepID=A0A6A4HC81_9AGAR|nr:hypothetical protein BT96DRAFT_922548 [Gymnopus androsaceus JB14]